MTGPAEFFRPEALEHHAKWAEGGEPLPAGPVGLHRGFWVVVLLPLVALAATFVVRVDVKEDADPGRTRSERLVTVLVRPLTGALTDGGSE